MTEETKCATVEDENLSNKKGGRYKNEERVDEESSRTCQADGRRLGSKDKQ